MISPAPPPAVPPRDPRGPFFESMVFPGVGHFRLRRPLLGSLFAGLALLCLALFFAEFWVQIRLFLRQAAEALRDPQAPLPAPRWSRLFAALAGLTLVYAASLLDIRRRLQAPPPVP